MCDCNAVEQMHVHFTYKENADRLTLCQGDILEKTEELQKLLKDIHPYFADKKYRYFIVLSQSCDLVRRNGKGCKTPYILLAAVRSFNDFFTKVMLNGKYIKYVQGLLLMDTKQKMRAYQLIERVYNNTEPDYFFLYHEDALDFPETMVAYLKLTVALKADKHYSMCLKAKKIELADEFKAKLGWLVGNIYSRVGTTDWESVKIAGRERTEMIKNEIASRCIISGKVQLEQLMNKLETEEITGFDNAQEFVDSIKIETKYDKALKIIREVLDSRGGKLPDTEKEFIMKTMKSRRAFQQLFANIE